MLASEVVQNRATPLQTHPINLNSILNLLNTIKVNCKPCGHESIFYILSILISFSTLPLEGWQICNTLKEQ